MELAVYNNCTKITFIYILHVLYTWPIYPHTLPSKNLAILKRERKKLKLRNLKGDVDTTRLNSCSRVPGFDKIYLNIYIIPKFC